MSKKIEKSENDAKFNRNLSFFGENQGRNDNSYNDFKKSLGQNFLYDKNLLKAIVADGLVESGDTILEIGAGAGTLTEQIALTAKSVLSYEIDESLKPYLIDVMSRQKNVTLRFEDFLKTDMSTLPREKMRVVANIPYYITTPIIFKLVEHIEKFKSILVLIQKEVAERFAAKCGGKEYGITSVVLQSIFDVSIPRIVKKECFTPSPKIDSALCLLVPNNKYKVENINEFSDFVKLSFSMRRKTLVNNLKSRYDRTQVENVLKEFSFDLSIRPEQVSVENFVKLFKKLRKN